MIGGTSKHQVHHVEMKTLKTTCLDPYVNPVLSDTARRASLGVTLFRCRAYTQSIVLSAAYLLVEDI